MYTSHTLAYTRLYSFIILLSHLAILFNGPPKYGSVWRRSTYWIYMRASCWQYTRASWWQYMRASWWQYMRAPWWQYMRTPWWQYMRAAWWQYMRASYCQWALRMTRTPKLLNMDKAL